MRVQSIHKVKGVKKHGEAIYLPSDISHGFVNDPDKPCAMICVGANIFHASST
jgi:quercetin dioxygenase-like cupin family protein